MIDSKTKSRIPLQSKANQSLTNKLLNQHSFYTKNTTKVYQLNGSPISVSQNQVNFIDIQISQPYQIQINVKNTSNINRRVKILKPNDNRFEINYKKDGSLAPGLSLKVSVVFQPKQASQIHSSFKILSQSDFQQEIPINVYPPLPNLVFQPVINFGFIKIGKSKVQQLFIQNNGIIEASIKLNSENQNIEIYPKETTIRPKQKMKFTLTITPTLIGAISGTINILPKQRLVNQIQFTGNAIEFTRFLINKDGKQIDEMQIEPILVGDKTQISLFLVNNTPKSTPFRINQKKGLQSFINSITTPEEVGRQDTERILYFSPLQGEIQPYSEKKIIFNILGKKKLNDQNSFLNYILANNQKQINEPLQNHWHYTVIFHFDDDENQQIKLNVRGSCLIPKLKLSQTSINFDIISVASFQQKILKIENQSNLDIPINFPKSLTYSFKPNKFILEKNSASNITVIFKPKKVGEHNQLYNIEVGIFLLPFKLFGKAKFHAVEQHHSSSNPAIQSYDQSFECISIIKQNQLSRFLNQSNIQISSIISQNSKNLINTSKDESVLKIARKNRLERKKESEMEKIISQCKSYEQNKPMDYQFQNKLNSKVTQHHISLETSKDPLYLQGKLAKLSHQNLKQNTTHNIMNNSIIFDSNKQIIEYGSQPKNQNEQRIINQQLLPEQLRLIQVGPTTINLGTIFINCQTKAYFHIINHNKIPISAQISNLCQQLGKTNKNIQIIPANTHGGIKIIFEALKIGQFKSSVQYILNGKHFFQFNITGVIILPNLNLSKTQLKFFFTQQDKEFYKSEKIILKNNFDYEAKFKWINSQEKVFQISPSEGIVSPQTELAIIVKYNINNSLKQFQSQTKIDQDRLRLRIVDGNQYVVKCSSQVTQSSCVCKPSELNFKDISVCRNVQQRFFIKNVGRSATVFKIDYQPQLEGIIQIFPQKKHLSMEQTAQIIVKFYSIKSGNINTNLLISLRGGKSINLPLKANIILPKVYIEQEEIDFGSTPKSGTPAEKKITLINDSNIIVDLQLNLGNHDSVLYKCFSLEYLNNNDENITITSTKLKDPKYVKPNIYNIKMNPKCSTKLKLYFTPEDITTYNFILPLNISGYNQFLEDLQKQCNCKGILNKMMVQPQQLDFKRVIIQSEKGLSKTLQVELKNPTNDQIQWWVGSDDISPFDLSIKKGKIKGLKSQIIKINFYPSQPGEFNKQINFFIDQPEMELTHCYLSINVKACSDYPCIIFDRPYIIMPVVPLNTQSRCIFQIFNDGYENLNLKHIIVQELSNIDINLNYLNGANLGITKKKIKLEAVFKSQKPISFTLNAQFYDDSNRVYSIPISGTADNSMFTIQQYFNTVKSQQQQIQAVLCQSDYLKRYFNTHVCYQKPLTKYPECLLQNDLQLFFEILSYYTTGFEKLKATFNKKGTKIQQIFGIIDEVIRILKSEGALLNHIRPQLLLTYQDFINFQKTKQNVQNYYQIPWIDNQINYNHLNRKYWNTLIYQLMKIYDPYKINVGANKSSKMNINLKNIQQLSNKMTFQEKQLLAWAQTTYNSESRLQTIKTFEDFSNLMDCEVLSALILKYTGNKILDGFGRLCNTKKEIQKRCSKFIQVLANIGIYSHVKSEDIERSNHRQMLVLLEQLFHILPNYLPKSQIIQFSCCLGQSVTKAIEISNPSKQTVSYWAKIQGSQDFVMQSESSFVIQSKKSFQFKIKYLSNFSNTSSATITFIGKKDNKTTPATMVFSLKGNTLGRVSQKSIQITNPLYEQLQFQINVANNLQSDGQFKIQLFMQQKKQNKFNSFYCFTDKIKIKKGSSANLNLVFAPMIMQTQKCYLYFFDQNAGQFQYQLIGLVQMPQISGDTLRLPNNIFVDTPTTVQLTIPYKNDLISKARKQLQILTQRKSHKIKAQSMYPKLASQLYSVEMVPTTEMINYPKEIQLFFSQKDDFTNTPTNGVTIPQRRQQIKKIPISLNIKMTIKQGVLLLIIKNNTKTDIRRYRIILNVSNKPLKYVMEIKTNLFKQIVQPIPLINPSNQQNVYHIQLLQDPKQNYAIDTQKQVHVDYGKIQYVNLTFKPKSVGEFISTLRMQNSTIGQLIQYELVGISQQPEATELSFTQNAKEQKNYQIKVTNQTNAIQRFNVKIDLQHATGPQLLNIPPYSALNYVFTFNPKYINLYKGNITFEEDGRYFVYKIIIDTRETHPIRQYNIVSKQRMISHLQLQVQEGDWTVKTSDQKLTGLNIFNSTTANNKYQISYISGKKESKKALIYFHNQIKGDFCYLININILQAPEIKLNPFKVQLGKIHKQQIELQNFDNQKVRVFGKSSNPNTFSFQPNNIWIEAKGKICINIIYNPSNLETEFAAIMFQSQTHQKWKYLVSGFGILPTYQQQKIIQGELNKDTSAFINFRNPFKQKIQVNISLQKNSVNEDIFQLIMKNKRVEIQPLGLISIPIVFIPKFNQRYQNTLIVYMNQRMSWKFSMVGISTTHCQSIHKHYKFKCREKKIDVIQFCLNDLPNQMQQQNNEFTLKLKDVIPSINKQIVEKSISIVPIKSKLNPNDNIIRFGIEFQAFKPFEAICVYQISQKNQCKWFSRVQIKCLQPQYDDQITIVSQINNLASVNFKLTNRFKTSTKFNSYFTPESDIQLTVVPQSGELSAYGRQGTNFQINFHPIQYRKYRSGKLIIQTEDSYWSYLVKGVLPHYSPPIGKSTLTGIHNSFETKTQK